MEKKFLQQRLDMQETQFRVQLHTIEQKSASKETKYKKRSTQISEMKKMFEANI